MTNLKLVMLGCASVLLIHTCSASKSEEPAFSTSATSLQSDYDTNEVAADLVYRDKWFRVTGKLDKTKIVGDEPAIEFRNGAWGTTLALFKTTVEPEIAKLSRGS